MPKKARSSDRERTVQVGLRIPESLLERIDAHRDRLRVQTGVVTLGRTEAALALLVRGLEAVEERRRPG